MEKSNRLNPEISTRLVKSLAAQLGFEHCGIAKAKRLDEDAKRLESWLNNNFHGSMKYMENYFDLRVDPSKLVPGARSVITLLTNYYPEARTAQSEYKVSKYAWGRDYHEIIRDRLRVFLARMQEQLGEINGRGFVDSAPVLERAWAVESGLGWVGRNGNMITKGSGSFFFIATLIVDIELSPDDAFAKDYCGSCRRCIDACPTGALLDNKVVDGSRCISYYTIELKEAMIPSEMAGKFDNWMFGCDACQDVCPWNRFSKPNHEPGFEPIREIFDMNTQEWASLTEESFRRIFKNSPLRRSKWQGILRNIRFLEMDKPAD